MRTFLAIEMPTAAEIVIRQTQQALENLLATAQQQAIRWTVPASVHLTLRFLGDTTDEQRRLLQTTLPPIVAEHQPFTLQLQGIGCFPNVKTPSIIWLGLQPADQTLFQLQAHLEKAAQSAGFAIERKPFRPHLTIGRMRQSITRAQQQAIGQLLARALAAAHHQPTPSFVVTRVVHMRSELEPSGARYTPLQLFNLAGAEAVV